MGKKIIIFLNIFFILFISGFFYLDRQNAITSLIQSLGWVGVILALFLMALLCMTPIPSEGLLLMYLKIYGVFGGTFLGWLGSNLGAIIIFFIVRYYGNFILQRIIKKERYETVNEWVERRGTVGLFIARLLPIPPFAVNYIGSLITSVKFWPYLWTQMVTIIPYYVGTTLVFMGVAKETWYWFLIGGTAISLIWGISYLLNRKLAPTQGTL